MNIISRVYAKELKKTRYFTGIPCKNGHISERYTSSAICCMCKLNDNKKKQYNYNREPDYYKKYASRRKVIDSVYKNKEYVKSKIKIQRQLQRSRRKITLDELSMLVFSEANLLCEIRVKETGIIWEVDHMIPLNAKSVSGLHVYYNIQVIPMKMNRFKSNKLILTNRNEWINLLKMNME